jgi:hypothetical protein
LPRAPLQGPRSWLNDTLAFSRTLPTPLQVTVDVALIGTVVALFVGYAATHPTWRPI